MEAQLRALLNPSDHHSTIIFRGLRGDSIGPPLREKPVFIIMGLYSLLKCSFHFLTGMCLPFPSWNVLHINIRTFRRSSAWNIHLICNLTFFTFYRGQIYATTLNILEQKRESFISVLNFLVTWRIYPRKVYILLSLSKYLSKGVRLRWYQWRVILNKPFPLVMKWRKFHKCLLLISPHIHSDE